MSESVESPNFRAFARTLLAGLEYYGIHPPFMESEHRLVPRLVRPGATALDIGANVGAYTCQLARLVGPKGRVVAFEAYPPSFARLSALVRFLSLANVATRNVALIDSDRPVRLARPPPAFGGSLHGFVHEATEASPLDIEVPGRTLDEEVEEIGLTKVDFIKCDVEGGEAAVMAGGLRTIRTHRPTILCEVEDRWSARYGRSGVGVVEELMQQGRYDVFSYIGTQLVPWSSTRPSGRNLVFLPAA